MLKWNCHPKLFAWRLCRNCGVTLFPISGRGGIDDTQELHYPRIMQAILDTGNKSFVAQEFVPKRRNVLASLKQGVRICDV